MKFVTYGGCGISLEGVARVALRVVACSKQERTELPAEIAIGEGGAVHATE